MYICRKGGKNVCQPLHWKLFRRLPTGNCRRGTDGRGIWRLETGDACRHCRSLWLLLWALWSVAAYAITFHSSNKVDNKHREREKRKMEKNLLAMKSQMQSAVVGAMRCRQGRRIQQILSIRFRYGFSSLVFSSSSFFTYFFFLWLFLFFFSCLFSKLA